ncbi:MAG TPA: hypothetical protein VGL39_07910 [Jatrophihabitantaceae bacterium]
MRIVAMNFEELTLTTRASMLAALEAEDASERPFRSKLLTEEGHDAYLVLVREALDRGDEVSFGAALTKPRYWKETDSAGKTVDMPSRAVGLALTEFNTWYVAGLADILVSESETHCQVYRAADPLYTQGACSVHEEKTYSLEDVVKGHRIAYHPRDGVRVRDAFTIPSVTGCHHTIRRVRS